MPLFLNSRRSHTRTQPGDVVYTVKNDNMPPPNALIPGDGLVCFGNSTQAQAALLKAGMPFPVGRYRLDRHARIGQHDTQEFTPEDGVRFRAAAYDLVELPDGELRLLVRDVLSALPDNPLSPPETRNPLLGLGQLRKGDLKRPKCTAGCGRRVPTAAYGGAYPKPRRCDHCRASGNYGTLPPPDVEAIVRESPRGSRLLGPPSALSKGGFDDYMKLLEQRRSTNGTSGVGQPNDDLDAGLSGQAHKPGDRVYHADIGQHGTVVSPEEAAQLVGTGVSPSKQAALPRFVERQRALVRGGWQHVRFDGATHPTLVDSLNLSPSAGQLPSPVSEGYGSSDDPAAGAERDQRRQHRRTAKWAAIASEGTGSEKYLIPAARGWDKMAVNTKYTQRQEQLTQAHGLRQFDRQNPAKPWEGKQKPAAKKPGAGGWSTSPDDFLRSQTILSGDDLIKSGYAWGRRIIEHHLKVRHGHAAPGEAPSEQHLHDWHADHHARHQDQLNHVHRGGVLKLQKGTMNQLVKANRICDHCKLKLGFERHNGRTHTECLAEREHINTIRQTMTRTGNTSALAKGYSQRMVGGKNKANPYGKVPVDPNRAQAGAGFVKPNPAELNPGRENRAALRAEHGSPRAAYTGMKPAINEAKARKQLGTKNFVPGAVRPRTKPEFESRLPGGIDEGRMTVRQRQLPARPGLAPVRRTIDNPSLREHNPRLIDAPQPADPPKGAQLIGRLPNDRPSAPQARIQNPQATYGPERVVPSLSEQYLSDLRSLHPDEQRRRIAAMPPKQQRALLERLTIERKRQTYRAQKAQERKQRLRRSFSGSIFAALRK